MMERERKLDSRADVIVSTGLSGAEIPGLYYTYRTLLSLALSSSLNMK